jgi:hypothetical protein
MTLQKLYLFQCSELKELPTSIGQLTALRLYKNWICHGVIS